jgi:hypothetical protein
MDCTASEYDGTVLVYDRCSESLHLVLAVVTVIALLIAMLASHGRKLWGICSSTDLVLFY